MRANETHMMLTQLLSVFPNHTLNDYATERWVVAMQEVDATAAKAAMEHWIDNQKWFPTIAEFKSLVLDQLPGLPSPDEAWRMVMDRIRDTYPGHSAALWMPPDAVKQAVDDVGGLRTIRFSESPARKEREFKEAYDERRRSAVQQQMRQALPQEGRRELA